MVNPATVPTEPLAFNQRCVRAGVIFWIYHVSMRLWARDLARDQIVGAVDTYEVIEGDPDDKYLPSYQLPAHDTIGAIHAVLAADVDGGDVRERDRISSHVIRMGCNTQEEDLAMKCHVCGSSMTPTRSDRPSKLDRTRVVSIRELLVHQCTQYGEHAFEDQVRRHIEATLSRVHRGAELEIVRFAA